jgi:hypothetical protein
VTLPINEATVLGSLYGAVKRYPGKVKALAMDMDVPESTLYARLRGTEGYPMAYGAEVDEILDFLRDQNVKGWEKTIHVFCHRHDHLAIPIPRALKDGSHDGLRQVSQMMNEVAEIAKALSDGVDEHGDRGSEITTDEMKRIDAACQEAMEKIAETLEFYRARHLSAKKNGLVK